MFQADSACLADKLGLVLSVNITTYGLIHPSTKSIYFEHCFPRCADKPYRPLAVCKGLVIDRIQRLSHRTSVFRTRRARASYGILHDERYNKRKHLGQSPTKNPLDGNKYVRNQIDWLIRKGEDITEDEPIIRKYSRIFSPDHSDKSWSNGVVKSTLAPDKLPTFWNGNGDVELIYHITSDLGPSSDIPGVTPKRKNLVGKKLLLVNYELLTFLDPEDLRFETRVSGEAKNGHQVLGVEWTFVQEDQPTEGRREGNRSQGGYYMGV